MTGNPRGRRPGGPSAKRKADEELSSNPNTKKARERQEGLSEDRRAYENAKKAYKQQWSRIKAKLQKSTEWLQADEKTQAALEANAKSTHDANYIALGRHPDHMSLAQSAITMPRGAGEIPDDDGNPLWVEIRKLSTQDILQLEIIDQHLNVEEPATTFAQKSAKEMICQQIENDRKISLQTVQQSMDSTLKQLFYKCRIMEHFPDRSAAAVKLEKLAWLELSDETEPFPKLNGNVFTRAEIFIWFVISSKVPSATATITPLRPFYNSTKIKFPLARRRNLKGFQARREFPSLPWWNSRRRSYINWEPSNVSMIRAIRGWQLGAMKSKTWQCLPGPTWLWDKDSSAN
ncbi:hypothetical protein FPOA_12730 [Fusarium poae]|uniref:Uncharacterized protein n=1 Tax=Fusarium poae TaxID=36050 RepID=A0A1B8A7Z3_FUSPO|nr:hypothetical protein FPOA_12763 [Fusarium poae]OBS16626.1 hypothetical protein FPOA_12759 [Fusarium poae]OBS16699.1 hypothetical protein FPOA_12730 [Fusarium poae]